MLHRNHGSACAAREWARPRTVIEKPVVHDSVSTRVRQEFRTIPEETARRNAIEQSYEALSRVPHFQHLATTRTELLDHHPQKLFRDVDGQLLVRLEALSIRTLSGDHARP